MSGQTITVPRSMERIGGYPLDEASFVSNLKLETSAFFTFKEYVEDMASNDGTTYIGQIITAENGDVFVVSDNNKVVKLYDKNWLFDETKSYLKGDMVHDEDNRPMYATTDLAPGVFNKSDWSYNKIINVDSDTTLIEDFTVFCDTTLAPITLDMPSNPTHGSKILIIDAVGEANINSITLNFIDEGYVSNTGLYSLNEMFATCELTFVGGALGWMQTGGNVVTQELLQ